MSVGFEQDIDDFDEWFDDSSDGDDDDDSKMVELDGIKTDKGEKHGKKDKKIGKLATLVDEERIAEWYRKRIYKLEEASGNVENALELCQLVVSSYVGFEEDQEFLKLFEVLKLFHVTLYEYGINNNKVGLAEFESFDNKNKLMFLIQNCKDYTTVIETIETQGQLFVSDEDLPIALFEILPNLCKQGHLTMASEIFKHFEQFDLLGNISKFQQIKLREKRQKQALKQAASEDTSSSEISSGKINATTPTSSFATSPSASVESDVFNNLCQFATVDDRNKRSVSREVRSPGGNKSSSVELLVQFIIDCCYECEITEINIWRDFDAFLGVIGSIRRFVVGTKFAKEGSSVKLQKKIDRFRAILNGAITLVRRYSVFKTLKFYHIVRTIGCITDDEISIYGKVFKKLSYDEQRCMILKWIDIIGINMNRELQPYPMIDQFLSLNDDSNHVSKTTLGGGGQMKNKNELYLKLYSALHNLGTDVATQVLRGIRQTVKCFVYTCINYSYNITSWQNGAGWGPSCSKSLCF